LQEHVVGLINAETLAEHPSNVNLPSSCPYPLYPDEISPQPRWWGQVIPRSKTT